jgi:hypothetical protein
MSAVLARLQAAAEEKAVEQNNTADKVEENFWTKWYMIYLVYPLSVVGLGVGGYFIYKNYQSKK